MADPMSPVSPPPAKVTGLLLTGFLGAGKTTLLNRLLAARAATPAVRGKLAIVVNELGAIGVDGDLLPPGAARQVELPGGCICCLLTEDLDRTVIELLDRYPEVDTLVLETTGVAEPVPIVWSLERPPIVDRLRLAAVVTLVDPSSFAIARASSSAAEIQVESADVVLISKLDVASSEDVAAARAAIAALAPTVPVVEGSADQQVAWLEGVLADPELETRPRPRGPSDEHHHPRDHGIASVAVPLGDRVFDLELLEDALAELPARYLRIKGLVRAVDPRRGERTPRWAAVHRVGLRVSSEPIAKPAGGARIVALGPAVDEAALNACLMRAVLGC